ncbi:MAG: alpha/beta hydrolase [Dehalococcoidia bacterium]|nr:alpha/beta hydrolase [Dehalococcoidia bacterium]
MPFVPINGIELYYEVHGTGPAVVFAHGAGGNHLSWWQQIPVFAERFTCITYDARAFGRSRDVEGGGRQWFWQDLKGLLDHLGIERVAIVAQSMGGRTAVPFALRVPGRTWALVLAGTNGGAVTEEVRRLQDEYKASLPPDSTLNDRALERDFAQLDPAKEFLYRSINRLNPKRPRDFLAVPAGYRGSSAERLAASGIPVLFLVGERDAIIPPHITRLCHEAVPGSRYQVIEGAGHSAYFEKPAEFNAVVMSFLLEHVPV